MLQNPYQKYQQQSVMTMTPGEMLLKLYDETIKQMHGAIQFIEQKDYRKSNDALQKAQRILKHLDATLDHKYPISQQLTDLYQYFVTVLTQANVKKDISLIQEILPLIEDLRDAYQKADQNVRAGAAS